jgi:hypothetical protein
MAHAHVSRFSVSVGGVPYLYNISHFEIPYVNSRIKFLSWGLLISIIKPNSCEVKSQEFFKSVYDTTCTLHITVHDGFPSRLK